MSKLIKARSAQTVLSAEVHFNFDDTMVNAAGAEVDFGLTNITAATLFDLIPLPAGARVIGGSVTRQTAFDTAGYTVSVGDETSIARYLGATDVKAVGSTSLVPTGFVSTGEPIRISLTNVDVCTTGKAVVRVDYVMANRVSEVHLK